MASRSAWGTIESQLLQRRFTAVGDHLILLCTLSPLGGQASLRALERREHTTKSTTPLRHLYTGPFSAYLKPDEILLLNTATVFQAALLTPAEMKTAPRDNWGNVRVPRLEALETTSSSDPGA